MDSLDIPAAFEIASAVHANQKYGTQPYMVHPTAVFAETVARFRTEYNMQQAAILHDTLEDAPGGLDVAGLIVARCGDEVLQLVQAVTDEPGDTRAERRAKTLPKIAAAGWRAAAIKVLDRLCNARCSSVENDSKLQMYREEYAEFHAALHPVTAHLRELESAWLELDTLLGPKDTPEKLTHQEVCGVIRDMGGKEYPNPLVERARSFEMPRMVGVPDCDCNDKAPSVHINAYRDLVDIDSRVWPGGMEFEVCGEIGDGRWVRITFYSCNREETRDLYPDILNSARKTWTAAVNSMLHRKKNSHTPDPAP